MPLTAENLTAQSTGQFTPLAPPETLPLVEKPLALEPFTPVPEVRPLQPPLRKGGRRGDRVDFMLELEFSSPGYHDWMGSLSLDGGKLTELWPVGFNASWGDTFDPTTCRWTLTTEGTQKSLRMKVQGSLTSKLRLDLAGDTVGKSLGEILEPILSGQDVWQSRTLELQVGESGRLGFIVRGQPMKKRMVAAEAE